MEYTTVEISGIITQIAKEIKVEGMPYGTKYTEAIMDIFFPDDNKTGKKWILENNKRMIAICKFLNENDL